MHKPHFVYRSSAEHLGSLFKTLFKTTRIIYSARFPFCFDRRHVQKNQCGSPRFCVSKPQQPHCPVWRLCSRIFYLFTHFRFILCGATNGCKTVSRLQTKHQPGSSSHYSPHSARCHTRSCPPEDSSRPYNSPRSLSLPSLLQQIAVLAGGAQ